MKRSLHQPTDARRNTEGKHSVSFVVCALSLCVTIASFAALSAPAIAVTEEAANEIGIVTLSATPESATVDALATPEAEAVPEAQNTLSASEAVPMPEVEITPEVRSTFSAPQAEEVLGAEPGPAVGDTDLTDYVSLNNLNETGLDGVTSTATAHGTGTVYHSSTTTEGSTTSFREWYETQLSIALQLSKNYLTNPDGSHNLAYTFDLAEGIELTDELVNAQTVGKDGDKDALDTWFVPVTDENGKTTYKMAVLFREDYVNELAEGGKTNCTIKFNCELGDGADVTITEDEGIVIDKMGLTIPVTEITYPEDETNDYDLHVTKAKNDGNVIVDGDKLYYTVTVTSYKGTPDAISLADAITLPEGLSFKDVALTSATSQSIKRTSETEEAPQGDPAPCDVTIAKTLSGESVTGFTTTLPQITVAEENKGIIGTRYTLTYCYTLTEKLAAGTASGDIKNTVTVESEKDGHGLTNKADVTTNVSHDALTKEGQYDNTNHCIMWKITVNQNKYNIADEVLTDDMFANAIEPYTSIPGQKFFVFKDGGPDIYNVENGWRYNNVRDKAAEGTDYSISADSKSITFLDNSGTGANTNNSTYYVYYATYPDMSDVDSDGSITITNTASFENHEATKEFTQKIQPLAKEGTFNPDTNCIDWKLTVNSNRFNIANMDLTDSMFSGVKADDITIKANDSQTPAAGEYTIVKNADGTIEKITFNEVGTTGVNLNKYTITYSTPVTSTGAVHNTANFGDYTTGKDITGTVGLEKDGAYTATEGEVQSHIDWSLTFNTKHLNIAYTDDTPTALTDTQWATLAQTSRESLKVEIINADGTYTEAAAGTDYEIIDTPAADDFGIQEIRFKAIGATGANTNAYRISYRQFVTPGMSDTTVTNGAAFGSVNTSKEITVPGAGGYEVDKDLADTEYEGNAIYALNWSSVIKVPDGKLPQGATITDGLSCGNDGAYQKSHYITFAQVDSLVALLDAKLGAGNYSIDFQTNDWQYISGGTNWCSYADLHTKVTDNQLTTWKVTITKEGGVDIADNTLELAYQSTVNGQNLGDKVIGNKITLGVNGETLSDDAETTIASKVTKMLCTDKTDKTVTKENPYIYWLVKVDIKKDETGDHIYTVTDTLPDGVELAELSYGITGYASMSAESNNILPYDGTAFGAVVENTATDSRYITIASGTTPSVVGVGDAGTYGGQHKVTTAFNVGQNYAELYDHFLIQYKCKVTDLLLATVDPGETASGINLKNTVSVDKDEHPYGDTEYDWSGTIDRHTERKVNIEKSGQFNPDGKTNMVDYSLEINRNGKTYELAADAEDTKLQVVDILSIDKNPINRSEWLISLVPGSAKLYYATLQEDGVSLVRGNEVPNTEWSIMPDASQETAPVYLPYFTAKVPNSQALILDYTYSIQYVGSTPDKSKNVNVFNEASLIGKNTYKDETTEDCQWQKELITVEVSSDKHYTLIKIDGENSNRPLEGAEFSLFTASDNADTGKVYTTDSNGKVVIYQHTTDGYPFATDTLYYLKETKAPGVYNLPENPPQFYFYFSAEGEESVVPAGLPTGATAVDLSKNSKLEYVSNTQDTVTVSADKHWVGADGTALGEADTFKKEVKVQLYQSYTVDGAETKVAYGYEKTLNQKNSWHCTWGALPRYAVLDGAKIEYTYTLVETSTFDEVVTTITDNSPDKGTNGSYELSFNVENKHVPGYTLPETGGMGSTSYLLSGLALMGVGALGLALRKKRERGQQKD